MREIEFRGKRLDNCEWLYGDLMHDNQGGCYVYPTDAENLYVENKVNPDTVGQYTGLKDKNGVEIYEGDIVCITDIDNDDDSNCEVKFRNGVFGVENWTKKSLTTLNFFMLESSKYEPEYSVKVIGNIHDNPDLLTK